ncbi:MAG: UDP-N-acetylglucosamine 1-carboxyvinyltransferase [Victivallaceae bacterium]|nr:UDP-N-acetylglucosamine 1-carboxyvinyltransferase [Victivallaceae bacterium]
MESLIIRGKSISGGTVHASGNKNAVLPMIAAALLTREKVTLRNVPDIRDVHTMLDIARTLGAECTYADHVLTMQTPSIATSTVGRSECAKNRTSILFASALIARTGSAELYPPGGDVIGRRRLDGHFYGLTKLGAEMIDDPELYRFKAHRGLRGRELFLDECSVTATEQIMIAASAAQGTTTLYNAAGEPHVCDLARMLNAMGADISGIGSNTLVINGTDSFGGVDYTVASDHIEAGSFLALGAASGVGITVTGTVPRHYWMLRRVFERMGIEIKLKAHSVELPAGQKPEIVCDYGGHIPQISDGPWPQFPSDMMSCAIVAATQCKGTVMFFEKMFESRIYFADRLISMGANAIVCDPHRVVVRGPVALHGVEMSSPDIRAGMAMVIAAICASGTSKVNHAEIIYRGYENLVEKLTALGVDIRAEHD